MNKIDKITKKIADNITPSSEVNTSATHDTHICANCGHTVLEHYSGHFCKLGQPRTEENSK